MNRKELEKMIIEEGKKRKITLTECRIYDRYDYLEFYLTVENESAKKWVYKHQVENLIDDLAPIERPHKIGKIGLASRHFKIGDTVEIDSIWIKLEYNEKEPKDLINVGSCCGQWRSGWVRGKVVETPDQNDRALVIIFPRDIWYEEEHGWWGSVERINKAIAEGKIKKIEKGEPLYCGTAIWSLRKV